MINLVFDSAFRFFIFLFLSGMLLNSSTILKRNGSITEKKNFHGIVFSYLITCIGISM